MLTDFWDLLGKIEEKKKCTGKHNPDSVEPKAVEQVEYLDVPEKKYIEVSHDCAEIFYQGRTTESDDLQAYIESSSYIIYSGREGVMKSDKVTGSSSLLFTVDNPTRFIKEGRITTYYDMAYYVIGNELMYVGLDTGRQGKICHIEVMGDHEGRARIVRGLSVYDGRTLIYENGGIYSMNLEDVNEEAKFHYMLYDNHLMKDGYCYSLGFDADSSRKNYWYQAMRYCLESDREVRASQLFYKHHAGDYVSLPKYIVSEGIYDRYYYFLFKRLSDGDEKIRGYDCYYVDIGGNCGDSVAVHAFHIRSRHISQIDWYKTKLIYVDEANGNKLVVRDFLTGEKKIVKRKYGMGSQNYQNDSEKIQNNSDGFMRLGGWLWVENLNMMQANLMALD